MVNFAKIVNIFPNLTRIVLNNNAYFMIFRWYFRIYIPSRLYNSHLAFCMCASPIFSNLNKIWKIANLASLSNALYLLQLLPSARVLILQSRFIFSLSIFVCLFIWTPHLLFLQYFFVLNFIVPNSFRMVL